MFPFDYFLNVTLMRIKGTKNKVKIDLNGKLIVWKDFKKGFSYSDQCKKRFKIAWLICLKKSSIMLLLPLFFCFRSSMTRLLMFLLISLLFLQSGFPFQVTCVALCEKFVIIIQNHQKWPWKEPCIKIKFFFGTFLIVCFS